MACQVTDPDVVNHNSPVPRVVGGNVNRHPIRYKERSWGSPDTVPSAASLNFLAEGPSAASLVWAGVIKLQGDKLDAAPRALHTPPLALLPWDAFTLPGTYLSWLPVSLPAAMSNNPARPG